jgi:hypothetical protein
MLAENSKNRTVLRDGPLLFYGSGRLRRIGSKFEQSYAAHLAEK